MEEKTYIYKRMGVENGKDMDLGSQFDAMSKHCAKNNIKVIAIKREYSDIKDSVKSNLILATGTNVLVGEDTSDAPSICSDVYYLNYKTEADAIKNFVRDLELLGEMDKKGRFQGYINDEPFAALIRINLSEDEYYFTGGNNIDIAEIKEQYYNSDISKNDIFQDCGMTQEQLV